LIPKSKTDQEGEGLLKHLPAIDDPRLSAVSALRQWMGAADITEGPVFRAVLGDEDTRDAYMTTRTARRIIKAAGKRAGLDASSLSGHSLRSGFITQAALNGVPLWQIAEQSGHKPGSAVLQDYIRTSGAGARSAVLGAFGRKASEGADK
jgi:integrase